MKYISFIMVILVASACQQAPQQPGRTESAKALTSTGNFGNEFAASNAVPATQVAAVFTGADSTAITISGNITASCKHSGCWMDLDMGNRETIHVTFKDEAFTIPLDAAGKNAVAEGVAFRELIPVETLQNYAREEGKSEEEVAAITQPVYAYEFIASGVLIEE
jgi:uncharacterized protein YdeI (BOF family)